jgi:long-chain acyl-CoA synthetase
VRAEGGRSLGNDLREIEPTVMLASPRIWERLRDSVEAGARGADLVKRRAMKAARRSGGRLAGLLVQRPLRANLGLRRLRVALSATAPCTAELVDYWRTLGVTRSPRSPGSRRWHAPTTGPSASVPHSAGWS